MRELDTQCQSNHYEINVNVCYFVCFAIFLFSPFVRFLIVAIRVWQVC
jgi:hypothetical protein